jgi:hypothetical protein
VDNATVSKLKKQFHPSDLVLRCLALERKGYWVAMCVDLDLSVQADTLPQARNLLKGQMTSYVNEAMSIDNDHANDLMLRKAPLRYRLLYRFVKLVHATRHKQSFETAMPLMPVGA